MGFDNILKNDGIGIAATGMTIVFVALGLIAGFIWLLPRALQALSSILPHEPLPDLDERPSGPREEEVAAAIGLVLHRREMQRLRNQAN